MLPDKKDESLFKNKKTMLLTWEFTDSLLTAETVYHINESK
jgi:hypothetical protein